MGSAGRFGKYGEIKRLGRLRKAGQDPGYAKTDRLGKDGRPLQHQRKASGAVRLRTRPAGPWDMPFIVRLAGNVFGRYGPYGKILAHWFESGNTITFVALTGKRPEGFAMLERPGHEQFVPVTCELLAIAVEPARRRLGLGGILMEEVLAAARALRAERMSLHTALENLPAQRLFKRHGFASHEMKKTFYPAGQDALRMVRDMF